MAVVPAAKGFFATVGAALGTAAGRMVLYSALSYGLSKITKKSVGNDRVNAGGDGARVGVVNGTTEYQALIFGEIKTSGVLVFYGSGGTGNNELWYVIAHAGHQCEAILEYYVGDKRIDISQVNATTGAVSHPEFLDNGNNQLYIRSYLGTHNQAADATLITKAPEWTSAHQGVGVCYTIFHLVTSDTVWKSGSPSYFGVRLRGMRLYDPRFDSTNGGAGSQRYADPTTWTFSRNSALARRAYLTGGSKYFSTSTALPILGMGESNSRIDDAYTIAAANVCDELVGGLGSIVFVAGTRFLEITGTGLTKTVEFKYSTQSTGVISLHHHAYVALPSTTIDITCVLETANSYMRFGLIDNPAKLNLFDNPNTISYSFEAASIGGPSINIYESSTSVGTYGSYVLGTTLLRITYDGTNVRYYVDGALVRTVGKTGELYVALILGLYQDKATITFANVFSESRYTCDALLSCGDSHMQNTQIIDSSMLGNCPYVNGKHRIYAGAYDTPSVTITDDDIVGTVDEVNGPTTENLWNAVSGTFYDEVNNWQLMPFPTQKQSSYQTDDGGEYIERPIELRATRGSCRAQRIASVILRQSRNKLTLSFSALRPKAMRIARHETFLLDSPEMGYTNLPMRCLNWRLLPSGLIAMDAKVESSSTWADPSTSDYIDPGSGLSFYDSTEAPAPATNLTITAFPTVLAVVVTRPAPLQPGETVRLYESTSSTPFSGSTLIAEATSTVFQIPRRDTATRYYWAEFRRNGQVSSAYPSGAGVSGAADLVQTGDIEDNAATDIYTSSRNSISIVNTDNVVNVAGATLDYDDAVQITAEVSFDCRLVSGTSGLAYLGIDEAFSFGNYSSVTIENTQWERKSITSGTVFSYSVAKPVALYAYSVTPPSGLTTIELSNVSIVISVIKK